MTTSENGRQRDCRALDAGSVERGTHDDVTLRMERNPT
jgi:hypothetical protein